MIVPATAKTPSRFPKFAEAAENFDNLCFRPCVICRPGCFCS
jgi:hypothetical protein